MKRSEPVVDGPGDLRIGTHPQLEDDISDAEPVRVDQFPQLLQAIDLTRAVLPVTTRTAQGGDEAGLLEIAQHPLRPTGRCGRLLNGQRLHHVQTYHDRVRFAVPTRATRPATDDERPLRQAGEGVRDGQDQLPEPLRAAFRNSRFMLMMLENGMPFGHEATHSPTLVQPPKSSASIWPTMPSVRDVRSG